MNKIITSKFICWHKGDRGFWIRFFGHGICIQKNPQWFSNRFGLAKGVTLFGCHFSYLRRTKSINVKTRTGWKK